MKDKGKWVTVRGHKIFIPHGSDGKDVIRQSIDKAKIKTKASSVVGNISIKSQVASNIKVIKITQPIYITADYESTLQERVRSVNERLAKSHGIVTRADIGDVHVDSMSKKYIKTKAEQIAITAVPDIIAKGVIIHQADNHKGRDYNTVTIANRVYIDGKEGVMAVVVMETSNKKYKAHRVLTADGNNLYLE